MELREIAQTELNSNVFDLIGNKWMLIAAAKGEKVNAMTASWGGLGVMWGKNVAYIVIRPNRYTKEFIDNSDTLSLTFFSEEYRSMLAYMGKVSGRDEDKIAKSGLTVEFDNKTPYFKEAEIVIEAKKLYAQEFDKNCFKVEGIDEKWYPNKDYHTMYICEIEKILTK